MSGDPVTTRSAIPSTLGKRVYQVVRRIAVGRTGDTVLARAEDARHDEPAHLVKRVRVRPKQDLETFEADMGHAAEQYARLSGPAIAKVIEFYPRDARFVLVREHVDGLPLSRVIGLLGDAGEALGERVATYVASRIFAALSTAHAANVVHGALTPSNVLVSWEGHVKVSDFCVGRAARSSKHAASQRADVFAASIITWELLTGKKPTEATGTPDDFFDLNIDQAVRETLSLGIDREAPMALGAEAISRVLRGAVNEDRERALLVMAMENVRPPPESEPASTPDLDATRARGDDDEPESTRGAGAHSYAMVTARDVRRER